MSRCFVVPLYRINIWILRFEDDTDSDFGNDKLTEQQIVEDIIYPTRARVIRAKVRKVEQQSSSEVITPTLQEDGSETIPLNSEMEFANSNDVNTSNDATSTEKPIEKVPGQSSVELLRQNLHNMVQSSAVGLMKANDVIAFKVSLSAFTIPEQK